MVSFWYVILHSNLIITKKTLAIWSLSEVVRSRNQCGVCMGCHEVSLARYKMLVFLYSTCLLNHFPALTFEKPFSSYLCNQTIAILLEMFPSVVELHVSYLYSQKHTSLSLSNTALFTHSNNESVYCTLVCPNMHTVFAFGVCIGAI